MDSYVDMYDTPPDLVNHPPHYTSLDATCGRRGCGKTIECIDVAKHFNFNLGNVIKYIWRAPHKGAQLKDLEKAAWYLNNEIEKIKQK